MGTRTGVRLVVLALTLILILPSSLCFSDNIVDMTWDSIVGCYPGKTGSNVASIAFCNLFPEAAMCRANRQFKDLTGLTLSEITALAGLSAKETKKLPAIYLTHQTLLDGMTDAIKHSGILQPEWLQIGRCLLNKNGIVVTELQFRKTLMGVRAHLLAMGQRNPSQEKTLAILEHHLRGYIWNDFTSWHRRRYLCVLPRKSLTVLGARTRQDANRRLAKL